MPIPAGEGWGKLKDEDVIIFKNEKKVLGTATVGTLSIVNEAVQRNEHPTYLEFTAEHRDYYHEYLSKESTSTHVPGVIFYKMNGTIFQFKEIKLNFKKDAPITVKAFRANDNKKPLYSGETQPDIRDDNEKWQYVMMPVYGEGWDKLNDEEGIFFKDGEEMELGSVTAQVLIKTTTDLLEFDGIYHCFYEDDMNSTIFLSTICCFFFMAFNNLQSVAAVVKQVGFPGTENYEISLVNDRDESIEEIETETVETDGGKQCLMLNADKWDGYEEDDVICFYVETEAPPVSPCSTLSEDFLNLNLTREMLGSVPVSLLRTDDSDYVLDFSEGLRHYYYYFNPAIGGMDFGF
ncbi:hypothetical protein niasHS_009548 [Heterodera schachtii]|uniref:Ig-like domain-containing protein n=1 Tax=Heterodera schachtii TaxID=97005 RepID=A0ABD2JEJ2_HETSC